MPGRGENEFSLEELLTVLTSSFITIPYKERKPLALFAMSYDKLMTIEEVFTQIFMKMGGAPSDVNSYLSPSELLHLFVSYQSVNRDLFQKIIQENEAKCRKKLDQIVSLIDQFDKKMKEQEEKVSRKDSDKLTSLSIQNILPEEEYLIHQIYSQIRVFKDPEKSAQIMGEQIQKILWNSETAQEIVAGKDRDDLLTSIYQASYNSQIILRESTWADIDSEENLDILERILILCLVNNDAKNFRDWRTYILEHKNLWPFLSTDKKLEKNRLHPQQKNR